MAEEPPSRSGGNFNKKVGPLPLWAWALLAGGGIGLLYYLRRGSKTTTDQTATDQGVGTEQTNLAIVPVPVGQQPTGDQTATPTGVKSYIVKSGDTWTKIARSLGTTPQDLYYYQFSDAGSKVNSSAFRTKIAEYGPHSITAGNVIAYPSTGSYPKLAGFSYWTSAPGFWQGGKDRSKEKPVK